MSIRNDASGAAADDRWSGHPVLSALVSVAVFVFPIALSIVSATITAHLLPRPHNTGWLVGWWVTVLAVPTVVLVATDRLARRALPLAVLLKMTMVFPDRAPKRLAVARKAGNTRDLARRVEEARTQGIEDEPVVAAEKILALAGALNAHDRRTRGHGERVRAYTDLIADELDLPSADRDRLRWSALLHDIGKLAVHPHILNKPDKLDDDEWMVMKNHPLEGAKLTAPLASWLGQWASTIAEHHERYDGAGYPYGLAGEEISLGGRIVAVADCYDTMTSVRSYKRPMSPEAARAELATCAGSQFDPHVVRAFLDVSIGHLRPAAGPLAWLGSVPFVDSIPRLGQGVSALGRVGAAAFVVAGAVTVGTLQSTAQAITQPHIRHPVVPTGSGNVASEGETTTNGAGGPSAGGNTPPSGSTNTGGASGSTDPTVPHPKGSGSGGSDKSTTTTNATVATTIPGAPPTVPAAPTGVSAMAGNGEASVSWSAPYDGGASITSYTVTPYSDSVAQAPRTFASSATSQTITGLTNGTAYTFTVTATNKAGTSPASTPSAAVTPGVPSTLRIVNGTGTPGKPDQGDQVIVTYSTPPAASSFCSLWTTASHPDLSGSNVYAAIQAQSGFDSFAVFDTACEGDFNFGWIDLGQLGYATGTVDFTDSTIHWDGINTLTITLGSPTGATSAVSAPSVATYNPASALGISGTISSPSEEQF
ncbi:MAG: HD domain-containing phosphohydrolase [Acidimicrobiales bacterium]